MISSKAGQVLSQYFESMDFSECERLAKQILSKQPHNPAALYYLGSASEKLAKPEQAGAAFRLLSLSFPHNEDFAGHALRTLPEASHGSFSEERHDRKERIIDYANKPSLDLVENPAGKMYVPVVPDSDIITQTIRSGGIFDTNIIQCAAECIRPGSTAIDVGANFGQMSLLFAQMVGDSGQVVSIEADDYVHHVLAENIRVNSLKNVWAINNAAHNKSGEMVFFPDQDFVRFATYGSYGIDPNAKSGRMVETITIDSLQIEGPVSFMKIDVQGCDLFAMQGARETIRRHGMPIVFEYEEQFQKEFGTSFQDYVDFVNGVDYRFVKTIDSINYLIAPKSKSTS